MARWRDMGGRAGTAPSIAQELSLITGISASLAIADGSLSLKRSGGVCLPSWLDHQPWSAGPWRRNGLSGAGDFFIRGGPDARMGPTRAAVASQMMQAERCIFWRMAVFRESRD